jgi:ANTAR domain
MEDTLAQALQGACAYLDRTAASLGAQSAAVLLDVSLHADKEVEVAHVWSAGGTEAPNRQFSSGPGSHRQLDGVVEAGSAHAQLLRKSFSPSSDSFLVYRWRANRRAVAVAFGFAGPQPALLRLPEGMSADLDLVALSIWSASEISRLRAELNAANARLAGRKLVERAKGVLQTERGISEESAYAYLRGQSRKRRITLTRLAEEVVRVHGGFDRSRIKTQDITGQSHGL